MSRQGAREDLLELADDGRLEVIVGDVTDRSLTHDLVERADAVVNFASHEFTSAEGPALGTADVTGTATLLEAAQKARLQRFLLVSSASVYGPPKAAASREEEPPAPPTMAAAARVGAELFARVYRAAGVPILITRGVRAYGPQQPLEQPVARMIGCVLLGRPVSIDGDGSAVNEYLYIDDYVSAMARVLWKGDIGATYNIGSGNPVTERELAETILRLCGAPAALKQFAKHRQSWSSLVDSRRMRRLGWEPQTGLTEGLRTTIDWYRKNQAWLRRAQAA
jgi:dTDP-glucose 4,6-dehydratase